MKYFGDNLKLDKMILISTINEAYRQLEDLFTSVSNKTEELKETNSLDLGLDSHAEMFDFPADMINFLDDYKGYGQNQIFHNAMAVAIYSFVEIGLVEYCRLLDLYCLKKPKFEKNKGDGLEKVKEYFKNTHEIKMPEIRNWSNIQNLRKIRNKIVHNNSSIWLEPNKPLCEQKDYKWISQMKKQIEVSSTGVFFIRDIEYLIEILKQGHDLVKNVLQLQIKLEAN